MTRTLKSRRKKRRWLFPLSGVVLAAAGFALYGFPPSLQDVGRAIQSAVGTLSLLSAGQRPAEPVLRGTVYDRCCRELAVSYRLFSLIVNPVEIGDRKTTAAALAPIVDMPVETIEARLKTSQYSLVLVHDLEEEQARKIEQLALPGVSCKAEEVRFYPGHTAASHVLGFMGEGVGLAGVEGKYDTVLKGGGFRKANIPDIDFGGQETLGATGADLVLTVDIAMQKRLEERFRDYLATQGAEKGMGLVLEPASGRILALANQPSFNPNYFWKAKESTRINRIYNHVLDKELIRPIIARAAAIERMGLEGPPLPPVTVAALDYGFTDEQLSTFEERIQLYGSVFNNWESGPGAPEQEGAEPPVTGVQVGVTLASLVNGGWRITPFVVDSVYDHGTGRRYPRNDAATERHHVLNPALGVKIRRDLFTDWTTDKSGEGIVFTSRHLRVRPEKEFSRYSMQELFVGLAPAGRPKLLLLLAIEREHLLPLAERKQPEENLDQAGRELLAAMMEFSAPGSLPDAPPPRSEEHFRRFFISKRWNFRDAPGKTGEPVVLMPQMRGMSLRQALQQIDQYGLVVQVNGSGRVIAQYPLPGQPLAGIDECTLSLKPDAPKTEETKVSETKSGGKKARDRKTGTTSRPGTQTGKQGAR
ncbi:MAG: PASTA domain-containing protein [Desulfobulbus sp.]|jgi:cell division protein FtsI (penicillin-binding protein 3)